MALPQRQQPTPPRRSESSDNILDRIEDLGTGFDSGRNYLFYGDPGSGKTTVWSSFPKPILVIICSGGQKPGELLSIFTPAMNEVVSKATLRRPSEMDELVQAVSNGSLKHKSGKPFATIVLDHVTGFQDLKLQAYKNLVQIPQQKHFGIATQPDWNDISGQLKEHLIKLLSLPQDVVVIAQERIFTPGKDDPAKEIKLSIEMAGVLKPKVGASMIPGLAGWLHYSVDYIIQTFIRPRTIVEESVTRVAGKDVKSFHEKIVPGVDFCARTGKSEVFTGKFRVADAKLPELLVLGDSVNGVKKKPSAYEQIIALINRKETP